MRRYELDVNGKAFTITVRDYSATGADVEIAGVRYTVRVDDVVTDGPRPSPVQPRKSLAAAGTSAPGGSPGGGRGGGQGGGRGGGAGVEPVGPGVAGGAGGAGGPGAAGSVTAPIPGQVLEVKVVEGEAVKAGQPLLVMEAMKMENVVNAPVAGKVGSIRAHAGDAVSQGQELLVIV